jgi:hypothetical protein
MFTCACAAENASKEQTTREKANVSVRITRTFLQTVPGHNRGSSPHN